MPEELLEMLDFYGDTERSEDIEKYHCFIKKAITPAL